MTHTYGESVLDFGTGDRVELMRPTEAESHGNRRAGMIVLIPLMPMRKRHISVEAAFTQARLTLYYLW